MGHALEAAVGATFPIASYLSFADGAWLIMLLVQALKVSSGEVYVPQSAPKLPLVCEDRIERRVGHLRCLPEQFLSQSPCERAVKDEALATDVLLAR